MLHDLVDELLAGFGPRMEVVQVSASNAVPPGLQVLGERFLLRQALTNLLDNAIDFTPAGRGILVEARSGSVAAGAPTVAVAVFNEGEPIPDFALSRVTERFYSLPRPATGRKSTGLGLNFVQEVAQLHGGEFRIANEAGGVRAELILPAG